MDSRETNSSPVFAKPDYVFGGTVDPFRLSPAQGHCVSPGIAMEAYLQNPQPSNDAGPTLCSPPVAMSLRTRETSSMALKHIFEQHQQMIKNLDHQQMIKGAASSRPQHHQMGGFQDLRNHQPTMADLRKRGVPELDLSFKKAEDHYVQHDQTGFGSPISSPAHQSSPSQAALAPINGQLLPHNAVPQAVAPARLNPSSRQSTAQMTIFYSGNVNVYDDVPADKAHAIMILAGKSWSSSFRSPTPSNAAPVSPSETTVMVRDRSPSPIKVAPSQHTVITSTNSIAKSSAPPSPSVSVMASLASPPPSPALQTPSPAADSMKSSQAGAAAKRQHAGIELPHARKASLARFLEKRKDRVQVVQQDPQGGGAAEGAEKGGGEPLSSSYGDKPEFAAVSPNSKKQCIETVAASGTPSLSRSSSNAYDAPDKGTEESVMVNEHCFFH